MSTSFDEILGMGASSPGYYVPTGSPSGSYFPSFEGSMGFEGLGGQALKMEETLDFSSSQAALSFGDVLGGAGGVDLPDVIFPLLLPSSSSSVGVVPSVKPEKAVTPLTFMEEEEEEEEEGNPKWELELEHLISELDEGKMANLLDKKVEEELLHAPVKDFNKRTKAMKLGEEIKNVLKLKRKRMRNKQAATRSRARKETHVVELQAQVDQLLREKEEQLLLIRHLQQRTEMLERELVKARAPRSSA